MSQLGTNGAVTFRAAAILTTGYVDGTYVNFNNANFAAINIKFTKGSLTSLSAKILLSNDGTNWFTQSGGNTSVTSSTELQAPTYERVYTFDSGGNYQITIQTKAKFINVSVKGVGTVTSSSADVSGYLARL
jgi:hypothetical protein